VGKRKATEVERWSFANYEPQSFNQMIRVLDGFERALLVVVVKIMGTFGRSFLLFQLNASSQ
jgi:hypothetical protein